MYHGPPHSTIIITITITTITITTTTAILLNNASASLLKSQLSCHFHRVAFSDPLSEVGPLLALSSPRHRPWKVPASLTCSPPL